MEHSLGVRRPQLPYRRATTPSLSRNRDSALGRDKSRFRAGISKSLPSCKPVAKHKRSLLSDELYYRRQLSGLQRIRMEQDDKTGEVTTSIEELALYNMLLTEAIYELLADKGVLNRAEVTERIKKLKRETKVNLRPPN